MLSVGLTLCLFIYNLSLHDCAILNASLRAVRYFSFAQLTCFSQFLCLSFFFLNIPISQHPHLVTALCTPQAMTGTKRDGLSQVFQYTHQKAL